MTKEEIKKEYIERKTQGWDEETKEKFLDNVEDDFVDFYEGYLYATSSLLREVEELKDKVKELEGKWISVSERLPEFNEPVLVWCIFYGRFLATYEDIGAGKRYGNWRDFKGNLGILPPLYWMPLPESPTS